MIQPLIPKYCTTPPKDFYEIVDEITRYRIRDTYDWDIKDDLLTIAYRKYTVDKHRQKRKHRKMYKFFIKLNK